MLQKDFSWGTSFGNKTIWNYTKVSLDVFMPYQRQKIPLEVYPLRNQMARSHSAPAPPAGILAVLRARSSKAVKARCCVCRMLGTTYPGPHLRIVDNLYLMQILKLSISHDLLVHLKSFRGLSLFGWDWPINRFNIWLFYSQCQTGKRQSISNLVKGVLSFWNRHREKRVQFLDEVWLSSSSTTKMASSETLKAQGN